MMNKIKLPMMIGVALMPFLAGAQQTRAISLQEAINLGLANSKQLKLQQAKIDEAAAALQQAEDRKLPDASVTGAYMRLSNAQVDLKSKSSNSNGGTQPSESPKVNQALYGILNASLPLYAGGRIRYGIESAQLLAEAAHMDATAEKDAVVQNIVSAFGNLYKASMAMQIIEENIAQSQRRVNDLENLVKNGVVPRNDLLKAELQQSNTELLLTDLQNNYQLAMFNMNILLGLSDSTQLKPDGASMTKPLNPAPLDDYLQSALSKRGELSAIALREQASQKGISAVKAEKLPSVALTGGYIAADVPKVVTITNAVNIGLGVKYDIGSLWKNKAKVQEAQAQLSQLQLTDGLLQDQVKLQVQKAYLDLLTAKKKIEVNAKAVEQANENLRIVTNKYNNQLATETDRLDANVAQLQASLNYNNAITDEVIQYYELLQVSGMSAEMLK